MASLIITIISIALFAVVAAMGIYYGGQAYQNAQINAAANSIMNEAQQILYAERLWSINNGQPDISGMGTAGTSGTGMSALVNGKELAEWPSLGGTLGYSSTLANPGPQPWIAGGSGATVSTGTFDYGCYSMNGYSGKFIRTIFSFNNGNYILYYWTANLPYTAPCQTITGSFSTSTTDVSQINHPLVKIAKAINAAMNQIPANADTSRMAYIGLPRSPTGSTVTTASNNVYDASVGFAGPPYSSVYLDTNGQIQTNYCYMSAGGNIIDCVFGPS